MDDGPGRPTDPATQLAPYLRPGELLLWAGRPDPEVLFTPVDAFLIPFSILWGGFALFWEAGVISSGGSPFFILWGIPFVLVGLYFIVGRFFYKRRRKLRTAYGITPDRAMLAIGESKLTDSPIRGVPVSVRRSRHADHVSITFGSGGGWARGAYYANTGMDFFNLAEPSVGFFDVAHPDAVLTALEQARSDPLHRP